MATVRVSEVIGALSYALDLTEGQPHGHCARSCVVGMRIGYDAGLDEEQLASLFYALLLKDAGCSSNSSRFASVFGADDLALKQQSKLADLSGSGGLRFVLRNAAPGASVRTKAKHLLAVAKMGADGAREMSELRCERGSAVARTIGFSEPTARAIAEVDERWDGNGYPVGAAGEDISIIGRILCLAQTIEVFHREGGRDAALEVAHLRRGSWFDPALVAIVESFDDRWWDRLAAVDPLSLVVDLEPEDRVMHGTEATLDRIAAAFASVVDAKSPYTFRHSTGVARIAEGLAPMLGLDPLAQRNLHRAGLLHDIGKLGVSNRILDKQGKLTAFEWERVRRHPEYTLEILSRVDALRGIAAVAANHHERLDGRGYFRGLTAANLDLPSRILAVADVAEALLAERPYRAALSPDEVLSIMREEAGIALDADVFAALEGTLADAVGAMAAESAPQPILS